MIMNLNLYYFHPIEITPHCFYEIIVASSEIIAWDLVKVKITNEWERKNVMLGRVIPLIDIKEGDSIFPQ